MSNLILVSGNSNRRWLETAFLQCSNILKYKSILITSSLNGESKKKYLSLHDDILEFTIDSEWMVTGYFYSGNYPPFELDKLHAFRVPAAVASFVSLD